MTTKQLIKDIAELRGLEITDSELNDLDVKIATAYLDAVLDAQGKDTSADDKNSVTSCPPTDIADIMRGNQNE